jgi:hypothetical protein
MAQQGSTRSSQTPAAGKTFDPRPYLRTITTDGEQTEYLDVRWRLAWLRTEHPDARITTEHVILDDEMAVFRAMVQVPGGGCATGYGSETQDDWGDYIEKAETKAIGRALAALGYGTQFATDFESDSDAQKPLADSPVRRERRRDGEERPSRRSAAQLPGSRQEWTEFWQWARSIGYQNRRQLEELFEHPLDGMTPREVREELNDYLERNNLQPGEEQESEQSQ